ncbi:MAG: hypothetical protein V5B33_18805 [Candidatus Accumulibacter sp. UW20]|jgi:hypothetical protein
MKTWKQAFKKAVIVGSLASLTSMAGLAFFGRRENGTLWATLNAPSHWLWGKQALRQDGASLRYTACGVLIHHLSSGFWALVQARLPSDDRHAFPQRLRNATVTTAVAAVVDLALVPQRLTPGFQQRLSPASLTVVYVLFAVGLMAGGYLADRQSGKSFVPDGK